ncbi:MAG: CHRD domain-containing protein [Verrucomicrobiae bacterium]|nr:CHRD domain-containing protein [Verrucomicrobiae bacterium]
MSRAREGWIAVLTLLAWGGPPAVKAMDFRVAQLPNGHVFQCANCHVSPGGGGPRNPFGQAVEAITGTTSRAFWSAALAALDSDGDGFTNGEELGDPEGTRNLIPNHQVTNPGDPNSRPAPPANQPPTVALIAPLDGARFEAPALVEMVAEASDPDGNVVRVEFLRNGEVAGEVAVPPYVLTLPLAPGVHMLAVRATDDDGDTATSTAISVEVGDAPGVEPTRLTGVTPVAEGLELSWSDGVGPFVVQSAVHLDEPWVATGGVSAARMATVPSDGAGGYFRIVDLAGAGPIGFTVTLAGAFERPEPVITDGTGAGTLRLDGETLTFEIEYAGLSGPAVAAHIHGPSDMTASSGVMVNLAPFHEGDFGASGRFSGSVPLEPAVKAALLDGRTYVNIHTGAHGGGEIRGQVLPILHQAVLNGASERPNPVVSNGRGTALFLLDGLQLTLEIAYRGLSGPATMAHIHGPANAAGTAGVLIDLEPFHAGPFGVSGHFSGTATLTPAQLEALAGGLTYVNVHTAANPGGEIRGQIRGSVTAMPFAVAMSGAAERPNPVETPGTGSGMVALEGNTVWMNLQYRDLTGPAVAAHIHGPAGVEESAGVLVNLAPQHVGPFGAGGAFFGVAHLTSEQVTMLRDGLTYVNIHTGAHGGGEIRGQVVSAVSP